VQVRAERFADLADQGAPFTIVSFGPDAPQEVSALVEDKNKERLGFKMQVTTDDPPKMSRLLVGPPDELDAPAPKDYTGWTDLSKLAAAIRLDTHNPAMAVAVIRDGQLEQTVSGTRTAEGNQAVGIDEPWSVGSIGKPICATIIGRFIEMGKLDWGTTLGDVLGDLPMKESYKAVTLEQLMHHRSGVPADPGMRQPEVDRIVAGATDPRKVRENYAKDVLQREPIGKPDEKFVYSNAGYALLGVIAERVARKPYEQLVRELVFAPLGLKHSYTGADKLPDARPSGHRKGPNGLEEGNFSGPIEILFAPAGGGLFMSVGDLARFGEAHLQGLLGKDSRLLRASTVARLHLGIAEIPGGRQYACGWGIEDFPGIQTMQTHNGSNGTMRAQVAFFPKSGLVVASFVNAGGEAEPSPPLQAILAVAGRYARK
jgi:CubicO group peptidase (beta-lactamase class C family)